MTTRVARVFKIKSKDDFELALPVNNPQCVHCQDIIKENEPETMMELAHILAAIDQTDSFICSCGHKMDHTSVDQLKIDTWFLTVLDVANQYKMIPKYFVFTNLSLGFYIYSDYELEHINFKLWYF